MTNRDLQGFVERDELASFLRTQFPHLASADVALSPMRGGRRAGLARLAEMKPQSYERSRNFVGGDVTRLSAYLRHGVLTLAEVRDEALRRVTNPRDAGKLINEFAWRDYWQRLYRQMGEGIWEDREAYKTGYAAADYGRELPEAIANSETTLACMDGFARQLRETGYLHNHQRMWFAAYVVHWTRTRWQAGAAWFLEHLVDGDPASNNLSWQWVASTFASKPYIFNRENLERYTEGVYCKACPHARDRSCPFEREYEGLEQTLFPLLHSSFESAQMPSPPRPWSAAGSAERQAGAERPAAGGGRPLVWVHTDSLNPDSPMLRDHADSPAVFVWDTGWLTRSKIALKRIVFLAECLQEMPSGLELRQGEPAAELLGAARAVKADYILAQRTPDPRLLAAAASAAGQGLPVVWYDPPSFAESDRAFDLKRFSRYWQRAQRSAMEPTG